MTTLGIEPAASWLVAKCLYQLPHCVHHEISCVEKLSSKIPRHRTRRTQ